MEKALEKSEDKIQKICDTIRKETLEPALAEAERITREAKAKAEQIIQDALKTAQKNIEEAKKEIEQQRNVFHSSLEQAGKQALREIKQAIEHTLFNPELQRIVQEKSADPELIAKLIAAIVESVEREGLSQDIAAIIPKRISSLEVNRLLGEKILDRLRGNKVLLGEFAGGAEVKLLDKKMTLDITDNSLIELLSNYVKKDFRKFLFQSL